MGDFDLGEELVQEALLAAMEHWPKEGIPDRPGAWLMTTARRKALDRLRRDAIYNRKLSLLVGSPVSDVAVEADDRLRLIFTCCHPALAREAQLALTLRAVIGLTTAEIARAFLTSESAIAQRIVRAKRKIVESAIPYRVPEGDELTDRLNEVLAVLYLAFNEGYLSTGGEAAARRDLAKDAEWLASLLVRLMPQEPEAAGLLALMRLHLARAESRFDAQGRLVLLRNQDRRLWDHAAIAVASQLLDRTAELRRPGPYQLQAAIAACHAVAPSWERHAVAGNPDSLPGLAGILADPGRPAEPCHCAPKCGGPSACSGRSGAVGRGAGRLPPVPCHASRDAAGARPSR